MRFLLFLRWSLLVLLVMGTSCDWKMPLEYKNTKYVEDPECTQKIKWKVRNDVEARATCLEYFPTTFVSGVIDQQDKDSIICTVTRQFQCAYLKDPNAVSIFDKCYIFKTGEITMKDYMAAAASATPKCGKNGALPIFYTMTQAKHIAKEAHRKGIFKMWVNVDKDGKTIQNCDDDKCELANGKGFLLYKDQWKLHKNHHWEGDVLKATPQVNNEPNFPASAEYLFFRTKTDYFNNLIQGSFERATKDTKAGYVCEYPAKIVPEQRAYCDRMKNLGLNAMYDHSRGRRRCVYTTLTRYSMEGTVGAIEKFKTVGCGEKPSKEQSSGLDDGTASKDVYDALTKPVDPKKPDTYRVAAIKMETSVTDSVSQQYVKNVRPHQKCGEDAKPATDAHRQPFAIYNHFSKMDYSRMMTSKWNKNYPKDECTDFPNTPAMYSNTLAIRYNKDTAEAETIDVPVPARFKAICSIESAVDCSQKNKCNDDEICENTNEYNVAKEGFVKCRCARFHKEDGGVCKYPKSGVCGRVNYFGGDDGDETRDGAWLEVLTSTGKWQNIYWDPYPQGLYADHVNRAIVAKGCRMSFWSHPTENDSANYRIRENLPYGEYDIPQDESGTLNGWGSGMSTSAIVCECP